jgi:D-lactate dehydrogenase (cytochrome)
MASTSVFSSRRTVYRGFGIFFAAGVAAFGIASSTSKCEMEKIENTKDTDDSTYPITQLVNNLIKFLEEDQIDVSLAERKVKGKPWSSYHKVDNFPHVIVYPKSTEEVSKILKQCYELNIPITPYGGGTSLEGQLLSLKGGVSIDFSNMKKIIALHENDLDVTVQAGLGYIELNEYLKPKGLWFPLDPGPGASVGGMCACRCSGSTAVRYGSMRENVLNVTAVLSDGTIIKTGSRARKCSAGYDITRLLIGSEGTLAVITEATLKIYGIPKVSHAVRISFPRNGVVDAACTARDSLNCGVNVGRCELLDEEMVKLINLSNPNHALGRWPEETTLLYEITGISESAVEEQKAILIQIAKRHGGSDILTFSNEKETQTLWKIRKECLWSAMSQYPNKEPMITDVCVPLTQLPELIAETKRDIQDSSLPCPIIAHAGDGNFHVLIFFDPENKDEVASAKSLSSKMAIRAIEMGGTCTGEHGVGVGKKEFLVKEMGITTIDLMRRIKMSMDPSQILNPGKIIDPLETPK